MLSDRYQPADVEKKVSEFWDRKEYFKAQDRSTKPPYSIIMPPPNVTGFLHMGHAMDAAIQDCLIRWKRMSGFNALWLPGIDHAGIATQVVVEKELKKQGLSRQQLGRAEFVKKVWEWKEQYGERISNQQKRLGASCDWSRRVFTLDESVSQVVRKVFVELHKKGLLYRGKKLVNWSGPLESAISDLEVEHRETKGTLYHIRYPLVGSEEFLTVATTRPETLLGDVAVAVHPEDARYQDWIGKKIRLPLVGREIFVLADSFVDPQFGSGVVKITPAHDFNDEKVGRRHGLEFINILTPQMHLNENAGAYQGLNLSQARKKILEDLRAQDLLVKEEPHISSVGYCSRTGAVVEPYLSDQWFVRMQSLAEPAQRAIATGTLRIEPESWTKVYLHWLSILEDWCVSRQLWWGHQIPAWHCASCGHVTVSETPVGACEKCSSTELRQDEDVLDTWFSSALWPFSTLGWPQKTEAFRTFYPTSTLVTGHDILFFWVARMVMMGMEFTKDVPFRHVYLHGLVRDSQGRKMSKSLGNSIDPVDMIEKFGTDALRFSILAHIHSGKDLKISEQRIEGYRNFVNKLWNAARFCLSQFEKHPLRWEAPPRRLTPFDEWILVQLSKLEEQVDKSLQDHRFSDAAQALYNFTWYEFCDWSLEFAKPLLQSGSDEEKLSCLWCLGQVMNRVLRLMHPFAPFVTEEIYQIWPVRSEACVIDTYPTAKGDRDLLKWGSEKSFQEVELVKNVLSVVRNIRGENRISPGQAIHLILCPSDEDSQKVLGLHRNVIESLGRLSRLEIIETANLAKSAVSTLYWNQSRVLVIIPLEGLVDFNEEIKRLEKLVEKSQKDIQILNQKLSNPNFLQNADPEVVEADRVLLKQTQDRMEDLRSSLERFRAS